MTTASGCSATPTRRRLLHVDTGVPDPYYGGPRGFEEVLAMVERSCATLVALLREALAPVGSTEPGPVS